LLDVGQVAEMLGLSIATIRKWVLLRYIPYRKLGRSVRFSASEIQEWAKSRSVKPEGQKTLIDENEGGKE
jgi:excisionase family DNA binding protein